jgi:hypothetical protein
MGRGNISGCSFCAAKGVLPSPTWGVSAWSHAHMLLYRSRHQCTLCINYAKQYNACHLRDAAAGSTIPRSRHNLRVAIKRERHRSTKSRAATRWPAGACHVSMRDRCSQTPISFPTLDTHQKYRHRDTPLRDKLTRPCSTLSPKGTLPSPFTWLRNRGSQTFPSKEQLASQQLLHPLPKFAYHSEPQDKPMCNSCFLSALMQPLPF